MKSVWRFLKILKIELSFYPAIPIPWYKDNTKSAYYKVVAANLWCYSGLLVTIESYKSFTICTLHIHRYLYITTFTAAQFTIAKTRRPIKGWVDKETVMHTYIKYEYSSSRTTFCHLYEKWSGHQVKQIKPTQKHKYSIFSSICGWLSYCSL